MSHLEEQSFEESSSDESSSLESIKDLDEEESEPNVDVDVDVDIDDDDEGERECKCKGECKCVDEDEDEPMIGGADDEHSDFDEEDDDDEKEDIQKIKKNNESQKPTMLYDDNEDDDDDDDDDEEDESYLKKFDKDMRKNYLVDFHPEVLVNNYSEIQTLSQVVRNENGIIVDDFHRTIPFLTKYEKTRIIGQRAKQINSGSKPYVKINSNVIDGYLIAQTELADKKLPFIIRRPLPNGGSEFWKIEDLQIIH
jgi:DNA-directed RNA polymerase subunit K/omega